MDDAPGALQHDDDICYCYRVSMRKLLSFARRRRLTHASRMSECLGAGTGCGWCIPYLIKIAEDPAGFELQGLSPQEYAALRQDYIRSGQPKNEF